MSPLPSPATPLASAPTPTTPPLDVRALEELVENVQAQVEGLVTVGIECDQGFWGLVVTADEQGACMGKGVTKELHGQLQLEELLHLLEVEELEELEELVQALSVGQISGRGRSCAGHKVWNPGGLATGGACRAVL